MAGTSSNFNAGYNSGTISQVNNYTSNVTNHVDTQVSVPDPALKELYEHIIAGAMHGSAERCDAPKCHPETRKAVQENIFSWISHGEEEEQPSQLLWLTGPAGTGKTAVMGTISDILEEQGRLAASFYFASYTGSIVRRSKIGFVTTLAYQLQQHHTLKAQLSEHVISAIQEDPAIFTRSLERQMEALILNPLRRAMFRPRPPIVIVVDGIDECGEDTHSDPSRSKEKDQIEPSGELDRRFFTESAAGLVAEVFLDDKYDPDKDIRLFLESKFAELSRRYNFVPSTWPREEDIRRLVSNASGQFIYPATVIRFIDSPRQPPKKQLDMVLKTTPLENGESPFAALDALYTAVLNAGPSPSETVLWLKAHQRLCKKLQNQVTIGLPPSVWTIDRLFESSEGQAQLLLDLPSLVSMATQTGYGSTDSSNHGQSMGVPASCIPNRGWQSTYTFYHKSFLDFLDSPGRYGAAFPHVSDERVVEWIWERFHRVWECAGPEVPIDRLLLPTFHTCFTYMLWDELRRTNWSPPILRQDVLSACNPAPWYSCRSAVRQQFLVAMFILVHINCRSYRPCLPGYSVLSASGITIGSRLRSTESLAPYHITIHSSEKVWSMTSPLVFSTWLAFVVCFATLLRRIAKPKRAGDQLDSGGADEVEVVLSGRTGRCTVGKHGIRFWLPPARRTHPWYPRWGERADPPPPFRSPIQIEANAVVFVEVLLVIPQERLDPSDRQTAMSGEDEEWRSSKSNRDIEDGWAWVHYGGFGHANVRILKERLAWDVLGDESQISQIGLTTGMNASLNSDSAESSYVEGGFHHGIRRSEYSASRKYPSIVLLPPLAVKFSIQY
ncbi:hypothetical protein NMY22_g197 [Coprinellus aureogranulatus]|nr:hypothetical protein NMY22_g197 [Coprinellus aureogranulatus]